MPSTHCLRSWRAICLFVCDFVSETVGYVNGSHSQMIWDVNESRLRRVSKFFSRTRIEILGSLFEKWHRKQTKNTHLSYSTVRSEIIADCSKIGPKSGTLENGKRTSGHMSVRLSTTVYAPVAVPCNVLYTSLACYALHCFLKLTTSL